jgi:hypothetical protein
LNDDLNIYPDWPRWMTLDMAVRYSPFGEKVLKQLAKQGHIRGNKVIYLKSKKWVFDKFSIDEYINGFMGDEKVLAICRELEI